MFQYLFNFNKLFQKRLCQGTYGFSFKLQGKCNILLVLLQRARSINLAYETKIVDIRETKELLLDSLRASFPGCFGGGAGRAPLPPPPAPECLLAGYLLHDVNTSPDDWLSTGAMWTPWPSKFVYGKFDRHGVNTTTVQIPVLQRYGCINAWYPSCEMPLWFATVTLWFVSCVWTERNCWKVPCERSNCSVRCLHSWQQERSPSERHTCAQLLYLQQNVYSLFPVRIIEIERLL